MNHIKYRRALAILFTVLSNALHAQQPKPLFYHAYPYGSESAYNPLSLIVNSSFDILQITNCTNKIFSIQYANGITNVWSNVSNPFSVVQQYGWNNFLKTEIFPTSLKLSNAQFWPNYQLHLIGGGISYVATAEWFESHNFKHPKTLSAVTMAFSHFLNEVVENNDYRGPTVDPIADLLIFDPLGILLFSIESVPRFFSETLHAADWSLQPLYFLKERTLLNNGQMFSFKYDIPSLSSWRLFYLNGIEGGLGVTYRISENDDVSICGGYSARELVNVDNNTGVRTLTTSLVRTAGLFYDRNGSLLASLFLGGARGYRARLNIYPGLVSTGSFSVGFACLLNQNGSIIMGLSSTFSPVGLSARIAQ